MENIYLQYNRIIKNEKHLQDWVQPLSKYLHMVNETIALSATVVSWTPPWMLSIPMLNNSSSEEILPCVQPEPPLVQITNIWLVVFQSVIYLKFRRWEKSIFLNWLKILHLLWWNINMKNVSMSHITITPPCYAIHSLIHGGLLLLGATDTS